MLPLLVSVVVPKVAVPEKLPATSAPPEPSEAMPEPRSFDQPPALMAQSMTRERFTCMTKISYLPLLVRVLLVEPKVAVPWK